MGVYSGVYEYTQQIQEQIRSIQSIQVFVHLLSCRQDPCSIILTSHMSGYLMELIRDNADFKEAVRNVKMAKNGNNLVFQGDGSLEALLSGNVRKARRDCPLL